MSSTPSLTTVLIIGIEPMPVPMKMAPVSIVPITHLVLEHRQAEEEPEDDIVCYLTESTLKLSSARLSLTQAPLD